MRGPPMPWHVFERIRDDLLLGGGLAGFVGQDIAPRVLRGNMRGVSRRKSSALSQFTPKYVPWPELGRQRKVSARPSCTAMRRGSSSILRPTALTKAAGGACYVCPRQTRTPAPARAPSRPERSSSIHMPRGGASVSSNMMLPRLFGSS